MQRCRQPWATHNLEANALTTLTVKPTTSSGMPHNLRVESWRPTKHGRLTNKTMGASDSLRPRSGASGSPPVPCREHGCGLASRLMARARRAGRISVRRSEWVGRYIVATAQKLPGSYSRVNLASHVSRWHHCSCTDVFGGWESSL